MDARRLTGAFSWPILVFRGGEPPFCGVGWWHDILSADIKHPGDVNEDGAVGTDDILILLAYWT